MTYFFKSGMMAGLLGLFITGLASCSKHQDASITGTWQETVQTGQSIHGGQIDTVTRDTTVYTFTAAGRFNIVWHDLSLGYDSGTYTIQHDTLYLHDQVYGITSPYYIQSQSSNNIILKSITWVCLNACDTSVETDYLHR